MAEYPKHYQTTLLSGQLMAGIAVPLTFVTFGLLVLNLSSTMLFVGANVLLILALMGVFVVFRRKMENSQRYVYAIFSGDIDDASAYFEKESESRHDILHPYFLLNRGITLLYEGNAEMAHQVFDHLLTSQAANLLMKSSFRTIKLYDSLALALLGEAEESERRIRYVESKDYLSARLARAINAYRTGENDKALDLLSVEEPLEDVSVGVRLANGARAFHALLLHEGGEETASQSLLNAVDPTQTQWLKAPFPALNSLL